MKFLDSLKKVFSGKPEDDPKHQAAREAAKPLVNEHVGLVYVDPSEFDEQPEGGDS
jgi:catalase (peroxidase I)